MKKSLVIILAVAIIGGLGVYAKANNDPAGNSSVQGAQTTHESDIPANNSGNTTGSSPVSIPQSAAVYKDGTYSGQSENTIYGPVQVQAIISGGKIVDINFLQMPDDQGHTREVTAYSEPLLKQQTLKNQSAQVDFVSGATQTSEGYQQSIQAALNQAA